jgi:hypothetical protein
MAYEEWNREIPPEEQLREVSVILAAGLLRVHRHTPPPSRTPPDAKVATQQRLPTRIALPRAIKRLDRIEEMRRRKSHRELFWREKVRSGSPIEP